MSLKLLAPPEINVARRGKVIVTLVPARPTGPRLGTMPGIRVGADFDAPLPPDLAGALGA